MQTGIYALNVYMHRVMAIVKEIGEFPMSANNATVICGVTDFLGGVCAIWVMHKLGRKTILLMGHASMGTMQILSATFFFLGMPKPMYGFMNGFIFSFSITSGPVTWLIISEVCCDTAMGLVILGLYASCMQQVLSMEYLMNGDGFGLDNTLWLFGGENFLCVIFLLMFVKETRGLTDL